MRTRLLLTGAVAAATALLAAPIVSAAPTPDDQNGSVQPMIVGGHDATEEYSWMASLQQPDGRHFCGGSLVRPDWVVTAAHCVDGNQPGDQNLRIGSNDRTQGGTEAKVAEIIPHPDYDGSGPNDIALIKLAAPVDNAPVKIAAESGATGTPTRIIGWGYTVPGGPEAPVILQELDTKLVDDAECTGIEGPTELCTGSDTPNANACHGDSGGPEIKGTQGNWELVGATSRLGGGTDCAQAPTIYTDVVAHLDWINQHIGG